jgi:hypothetical protein
MTFSGLYANNYDIYDNPAIEAVINFRWREISKFFLIQFLRFLIFAICFLLVSWTYLTYFYCLRKLVERIKIHIMYISLDICTGFILYFMNDRWVDHVRVKKHDHQFGAKKPSNNK